MARGFKTGGRKKGTANKVTSELKEAIAASGETPLDYMLQVMRDPDADPNRRDDMARAAAPYLHPRPASVQQSNNDNVHVIIGDRPMTPDEWVETYCKG
jgi:hypothetical protein